MTDKWRETFRSYTTSAAFNLTLSAQMISMLHLIKVTGFNSPDGFVQLHGVTLGCLERRGLIELDLTEYTPPPKDTPLAHTEANKLMSMCWKLTPAGEHAYAMCELAGLIRETDLGIEHG